MSAFLAQHWARKVRVGSAPGKHILQTLADYCDEKWTCFPSQETLAHDTELGLRTVQKWIVALEEMGLITRVRDRKANGKLGLTRYRLNVDGKGDESGAVPVDEPPATDAGGAQDVVAPPAPRAVGDHPHLSAAPPAPHDVTTRTTCGSELPRELPIEQIDDDSARDRDHDQDIGGTQNVDPPDKPELPRWRQVANQVLEAMELRWNDPTWFGNVGVVEQWLANGWDPDLDILPTVEAIVARSSDDIRSLNYFTRAIGKAHADRKAAANVSADDPPRPKSSKQFQNEAELQAERMRAAIEEVSQEGDDV